MISPSDFRRRQTICNGCEHWGHGTCLYGHELQSPAACPILRFPAVEQPPPAAPIPVVVPCAACQAAATILPEVSWSDVLVEFAKQMALWIGSGFKMASPSEHGRRHDICEVCPHYKGFYCTKCSCIAYLKTALATSSCPDVPPRWGAVS